MFGWTTPDDIVAAAGKTGNAPADPPKASLESSGFSQRAAHVAEFEQKYLQELQNGFEVMSQVLQNELRFLEAPLSTSNHTA